MTNQNITIQIHPSLQLYTEHILFQAQFYQNCKEESPIEPGPLGVVVRRENGDKMQSRNERTTVVNIVRWQIIQQGHGRWETHYVPLPSL